ncbi:MAG: hypothetical protein ACLPPF_08715 [Rhodomicrobium sp.]
MIALFDNPNYWHRRAEQVTNRLAQISDKSERDMLLRLHEDYIRLACAAMVRAKAATEIQPGCPQEGRFRLKSLR